MSMKGNVTDCDSLFVDSHHCSATAYNCVADDHVFDNHRCVLGKWVAFMLTVGQEGAPIIEINSDSDIRAVEFAANGEYLVSGGSEGVRVWRVDKQLATLEADDVRCLAVSKDGSWIAAGTIHSAVIVWDATFRKVFSHREDGDTINAVDFSPDSTRLVYASDDGTASIWDIATRKRVQTPPHPPWPIAARYSPQGDRIATATPDSIRVWDSNSGRKLVVIKVKVAPLFNTGLLWSNDHLFVVSDRTIEQFEASTGSAVSEWPVPDTTRFSCIALPRHGEFIAYSTKHSVTFWDTATHTQLALIQHPQDILSIAVSPDDRFLAIGEQGEKITINGLSGISVSILLVGLWCI